MPPYLRFAVLTLICVAFCLAFSFAVLPQQVSRSISRVAYVSKNKVWIATLEGGTPIQVLASNARDLKWSKSGSWLAVYAEDKTMVISADGRQHFPIATDTFSWSPVNDELAFKSIDGIHIERFDNTGPHARIVMRQPNVGNFVWNNDGTQLAVTVLVNRSARIWIANGNGAPAHEIPVLTPGATLRIAGLPVKTELQPMNTGEATLATWSGDDKWILFWPNASLSESLAADGFELIAVPPAGGRVRPVSDVLKSMMRDHSVLLYKDYVAVSRDKRGVVLTAGGDRRAWTNKRVAYIDPSTGKFSILTDASTAASSVDWSPDGRHVAFALGPSAGPVGGGEAAKDALIRRRIWISDLDGNEQRQLTSDAEYRDEYPLWARSSRTILFVRLDGSDNVSLWTANPATGELQKVVDRIAEPTSKDLWLGDYGHIEWSNILAWTR